ncbi:hypothetical protein ASA1KI_40860 [Opitutales bacterium ASA1]|uniref:ATP-binding protein n=1 Tax=Congregicoccus parvus TaxID=3081749 RepID=UPI002B2D41EC|nr:hypothetical protein ASA1KI_40860 [Opitutales bacterium ASA1]
MILYCILSAAINTVTSLLLGFAVLLRRRTANPNLSFVCFAFSVAAWSGFYLLWQLSADAAEALTWTRLLSAAAILVPPAYMHFAFRLTGGSAARAIPSAYAVGILFAISAVSTDWIVSRVAPSAPFPFWPRGGVLYGLYVGYFLVVIAMGLHRLFNARRGASHARKSQIHYVLGGTALGFIGGATNFPMWFEIDVPPIGNGLVAVYVIGVWYAIFRFRLLEVNYLVTKTAAYAFAALPFALLYALVFFGIYLVTQDVLRSITAWLVCAFLLSFLAVIVLPPFRRRMDGVLERTLLKPFFSGRSTLVDLAHEIGGMRDENAIFERTVMRTGQALRTSCAVYVRGDLETVFRMRAKFLMRPEQTMPNAIDEGSAFVQEARHHGRAFVVDEVALNGPDDRLAMLEEKRAFGSGEVVVPVQATGKFYGLLVLGARDRSRVYTDDELSLLDALCIQVGLQIRARQMERRVNQTEKLISLGTLAAGLAHEMRNPLVSIKTFAALLEENQGDPDFKREFAATMMRDVNRIESIIENVAAFAKDRTVAFSWIRLDEVARSACELVRPSIASSQVEIRLELARESLVYGNSNQLTQVVVNLLDNAVQSYRDGQSGIVAVRVQKREQPGASPTMELSVADDGPGIPPEVLPVMFEPFATTKATGDRTRKEGMGLGLAIVKHIVNGHNGVIRVDSTPGRGTTFTVAIPCESTET